MLRMKRVYEPAARSDGLRILVDRLWPRGLSKKKAAVDEWLKEVAPSAGLRRWFAHDPEKWREFQRRYKQELCGHSQLIDHIAKRAARGRVTIVFAARDELRNDAVVLAAVVRARMKRTAAYRKKEKRHGEHERTA